MGRGGVGDRLIQLQFEVCALERKVADVEAKLVRVMMTHCPRRLTGKEKDMGQERGEVG